MGGGGGEGVSGNYLKNLTFPLPDEYKFLYTPVWRAGRGGEGKGMDRRRTGEWW